MKAQTLNTQEAPTKWWAARDAQMRNAVNATLHTDKDKLRAERMKMALELCYGANGFYISYGIRGISVKVDKVTAVRNRKQLRALEADWDLQGVVKKQSAQGVTYRF